jgi:hypothetical protein
MKSAEKILKPYLTKTHGEFVVNEGSALKAMKEYAMQFINGRMCGYCKYHKQHNEKEPCKTCLISNSKDGVLIKFELP